MNLAHLGAAFDALKFHSVVLDVADGGTFNLANAAFGKCEADSAGGQTKVLPNEGVVFLVHNAEGSGALTLNDTDGNTVATVAANKTAFCVRVGAAANDRWHAVVLGMGAS